MILTKLIATGTEYINFQGLGWYEYKDLSVDSSMLRDSTTRNEFLKFIYENVSSFLYIFL